MDEQNQTESDENAELTPAEYIFQIRREAFIAGFHKGNDCPKIGTVGVGILEIGTLADAYATEEEMREPTEDSDEDDEDEDEDGEDEENEETAP